MIKGRVGASWARLYALAGVLVCTTGALLSTLYAAPPAVVALLLALLAFAGAVRPASPADPRAGRLWWFVIGRVVLLTPPPGWPSGRDTPLGALSIAMRDPLKEWGVRDLLDKYCVQAGNTTRITPHSLRHTFASFKAQSRVSPFQLKEWLGHARLDTTSIYVHMARQSAKKVMEATSL